MDSTTFDPTSLDLYEEFLSRQLPDLVIQAIKNNGGHGILQSKLNDIGEAVASQSRQKLLQQFQQCADVLSPSSQTGNEDLVNIATTSTL